ncbi:MAG: flagellin [Bacteroidales bacterium]|nr:flagellin [Bacteroidales bacterium]MCM1422807.1 flagellin [bacterium]
MISSIQHNMLMMNAGRHLNINTQKKAKTAEKLASGYRINRAADDAAGLSISEKMRHMIRGLRQGTENAMDGISWVQIGDGSLEEAHDMLHRMTELAIKASNETYTDTDRAMMQEEFAHLQKEIDRLTDNTTFNEQHIFQEHEWPYHQIEGATVWSPTQLHTVREGENDLVITYAINEDDPLETVSITVDAGVYTTKALVDEIDTALEEAGLLDKGFRFQYTKQETCNLNLEGGKIIDEVSGGLSYLLYDNFGGGDLGALIGTTVYLNDGSFIEVETGVNDELSFDVLDATGKLVKQIELTNKNGKALASGKYTKEMLMKILQTELDAQMATVPGIQADDAGDAGDAGDSGDADTAKKGVIVSEHGTGIKLSSPDYIITNFKGNMFEIDSDIRTGVFYDNVHHSKISVTPGVFTGGNVLPGSWPGCDQGDPERSVFHIKKGVNNLLVLNPNDQGEIVIDLTNIDGQGKNMDGSTIDEMAAALHNVLKDRGINVTAHKSWQDGEVRDETDPYGRKQYHLWYTGLVFTTQEDGPGTKVGINKAKSTAYDTLFTARTVVTGYEKAQFGGNDGTRDENAGMQGSALINSANSLLIEEGVNDTFSILISHNQKAADDTEDMWVTVKVAAGTYNDASTLATEIQNQLGAANYDSSVISVTGSGSKIAIDALQPDITRIRVKSADNQDDQGNVTGTNLGFRDIFQGKDYKEDYEAQYRNPKAEVTLDPTMADGTRHPHAAHMNADGTVTIDRGYSNLVVKIDGVERSVDLSDGGKTWTWASKEALAQYITEKLKPYETNIPCTTTKITPSGEDITNSVNKGTPTDGEWHSYPPDLTYKNVVGKTETTAGQGSSFAYKTNIGATVTFGLPINASAASPLKITDDNKKFSFTLNGSTTVNIDLKTELGKTSFTSASEFASALQTVINSKLGKQPDQYGGVKVSTDNNKLVLTAGLMNGNLQMSGQDDTKITMDTSKGTFVWDLHKYGTPASVTLSSSNTSKYVNTSFKTKGEPTITLTLTEPGKTAQTITVKLKKDYQYTGQTDLLNDLNSSSKLGKYGITASISGRSLTFSTDNGGDGYKLDVSLSDAAKEFLFGYPKDDNSGNYSMDGSTPYKMRTNQAVKTGFTLSSGDEQNFTIKVGSEVVTRKLAAKTYATEKDLEDEFNRVFGDKVKVSINSSHQLVFESVAKGSGHTLSLSYNADSAMKKIFGTTPIMGATASISDDGKLTLTRDGGTNDPNPQNGSIYVESHDDDERYRGGSFIFETSTTYSDPEYEDGYHSGQHSFMDGAALDLNAQGKIDITDGNNQMTFYFAEDYVATSYGRATIQTIDITLDAGSYTMDELRDALQAKIDEDTGGERKMNVTVDKSGVRIEAVKAGSKYRIFRDTDTRISPNGGYGYQDCRPSGTFFEKIMCTTHTGISQQTATNVDGKQNGSDVYAVGRQDVKNEEVRIQKDGNDQLSLEFNITQGQGSNETTVKSYKLEMVLDPGYYQGGALAAQIQKQLDKALKANGLPEGLIEAVVGIVDTKVEGANDANALAFRLSETVKLPDDLPNGADMKYGVEAIGGTAAFSVFYATDGDIARAYIKGGKDISKGVEIKEGQNVLSVDVDDEHYELELMPEVYSSKELIEHLNELMAEKNVPLTALEDDGNLKLMHTSYGKHKISHLSGAVKNQVFFADNGTWEKSEPMRLRVSSTSGDWIEVEKPWMDTSALGVNTLTVEKYKYAQKAIARLKEAVVKVSEVRTYFGTMQNRLEHAIHNNQNAEENTQAAESRIRDTDISKEVMENSIHNILEQAGVAMMAQIRQDSNLALQLLE